MRGEPVVRAVVDDRTPESRRASVPTTRPSSVPPSGGLGPAPLPG
jgi:hypothetical protein